VSTHSCLQKLHQASGDALQESIDQLRSVALANENVFEQLIETSKTNSLGQITNALYNVGGRYRRSM